MSLDRATSKTPINHWEKSVKLAILADIHGNAFALKKVLEDIQQEGINQFIVLGDLVMIGTEPVTAIGMIRDLNPLCWIKGNTDM